ncbi:MAG TPA: transposase [Nitrososphaerales archaeon]|nr:transposase [Nitrososphaerales archaeon]
MSWHDYNESLVERGRILFDRGFASSWKNELKSVNKHKVGRPFDFPDSYIEFLAFFKIGFDAPYRMVEGAVEALSEYISFIKQIGFTQIRRRILRLMKGRKPAELVGDLKDPITAIVDSTGLTTTTKGAYTSRTSGGRRRESFSNRIFSPTKRQGR